MSDLQDIREYNAYHLADRADCGEPSTIKRNDDSENSPGADFLDGVRVDFLERFGYAIGEPNESPTADDIRSAIDALKDEAASEIADGAVPVYTYQRWQTFTDLAAWQEDVSELSGGDEDMTALAGMALYMIAERLVHALADELGEWADDVEANEDDGWLIDSAHDTVAARDARIAELARPEDEIAVQMSDEGLWEILVRPESVGDGNARD